MTGMNFGIIGAGNMAKAIVKGAAASNLLEDLNIYVSDRSAAALESFDFDFVTKFSDSKAMCKACKFILLAVKPAHAREVFSEIGSVLNGDQAVISIMAGVGIDTLRVGLPNVRKFVRVMPNLAAKVGKSVNAAHYAGLSGEERGIVESLLNGIGLTAEVPEDMFDVVTAVSGSGPAYFYMFIEALAKAGEKRGMAAAQARLFAAQTALGAAAAALAEGTDLESMRLAVCSKGGTTIEAVNVLQKAGIYGIIDEAVDAAYKRSKELSKL
jgi:pyrroline-5-carboxylate reductase